MARETAPQGHRHRTADVIATSAEATAGLLQLYRRHVFGQHPRGNRLNDLVGPDGNTSSRPVRPSRGLSKPGELLVRSVNSNVRSGEACGCLLLRWVADGDEHPKPAGRLWRPQRVKAEGSLVVALPPLAGAAAPQCHTENPHRDAVLTQLQPMSRRVHDNRRVARGALGCKGNLAGQEDGGPQGSNRQALGALPAGWQLRSAGSAELRVGWFLRGQVHPSEGSVPRRRPTVEFAFAG